jgi:hypothetical protein
MRTGTMEKVAKPSTRPLVRPAHCNGGHGQRYGPTKEKPCGNRFLQRYLVTILHYGAGGSVKGLSRF